MEPDISLANKTGQLDMLTTAARIGSPKMSPKGQRLGQMRKQPGIRSLKSVRHHAEAPDMDMRSPQQCLNSVREEYRQASRKQKTKLLNEARKRTRLNRKVLIRKVADPAQAKPAGKRRPRSATYGAEVVSVLIKIWEIFDYTCGRRLVPVRAELERLG